MMAPCFLCTLCFGVDMWSKCGGVRLVLQTFLTGDKVSTLQYLQCYLLLGWGGSDGAKAMIQNRKVVFVLIAVMTHSSILHLCEKQAKLVQLSFVFLVKCSFPL